MNSSTATSLRENLFKIIDKVLISGVPHEFNKNGKKLKIVTSGNIDKFKNLIPHKSIVDNPENLIKARPYVWKESKNV